jgi:hypothetical protein
MSLFVPSTRCRVIARVLASGAERNAVACGFDRLRLEVSRDDSAAHALYRACGYGDAGVPPRRVRGMIVIRTGTIDVDDTLLTWEKALDPGI